MRNAECGVKDHPEFRTLNFCINFAIRTRNSPLVPQSEIRNPH